MVILLVVFDIKAELCRYQKIFVDFYLSKSKVQFYESILSVTNNCVKVMLRNECCFLIKVKRQIFLLTVY